MGELYRLTFPNGKSYIGITTKTVAERFKGHTKSATRGGNSAVHSAIRKFGSGNVRVETLVFAELDFLKELEIKAINVFGTLCPAGYNLSAGGDTSPMHNPDVAKKVSVSMSGARNPMKRDAMRNALCGNERRKGQRNSEEHKRKCSVALKGKPFTEEHKEALKAGWIKRKSKGLGVPWNKKEKN